METSLHRQLKSIYAADVTDTEVRMGRYRIDAVRDGELIEIQHGSLAAIRSKISALLPDSRVRVVKPIVARKLLIKRAGKGKKIVDRRLSPKRCTVLDLFSELVYFCRVFPHPNLTLEVPLVEMEEWRYPGHGRRRRHRSNDFQVEDQKLTSVGDVHELREAEDLLDLLPQPLPAEFGTAELAAHCSISAHFARQVAYCLRETGAVTQIRKRGNALIYRCSHSREKTTKTSRASRRAG
ncbi:MAG: hypothetical protein KDB23_19240 [Planctomycetales bacterium]|nr:hypothetical protein [Planctomycetales bacterium]